MPGLSPRKLDDDRALWTNRSVRSLAAAAGTDPLKVVMGKARETVFRAIQSGWTGPPYDPFTLAELLDISVEPSQDVVDARTVCVSPEKFRIEFNPNRSPARINFSVAHEIAHTFFPDCDQAIRYRSTHTERKPDDWQLEMLCNVGAAEILMPVGSFRPTETASLSIDTILTLQREYSVSTEAILLRIAKLATHPCSAFATHRYPAKGSPRYRLDYSVPSRNWPDALPAGFQLPTSSVVSECTAIGFTAKAAEEWIPHKGRWRIECLGIAPYPSHLYPRVVGFAAPIREGAVHEFEIQYLKGDATQPRGSEKKIIVQIVNDKAITWGKGFALSVRKKWPHAQREFTQWVFNNRAEFKLGNIHTIQIDESLELTSLIAQHRYGPSLFPRIQYAALETCLSKLAAHANAIGATIHCPRIGSGEAGGDWKIVSEIIDQTLCRQRIPVAVYDLPTRNGEIGKRTRDVPVEE